MANSYVEYTGNGSTTTYAIPFPFLEDAHVIAEVNGVTTSITVSGGNAVFSSAPASDAVIRISRSTSPTTRLVDYTSPSTLTEEILDTDSLQAFTLHKNPMIRLVIQSQKMLLTYNGTLNLNVLKVSLILQQTKML